MVAVERQVDGAAAAVDAFRDDGLRAVAEDGDVAVWLTVTSPPLAAAAAAGRADIADKALPMTRVYGSPVSAEAPTIAAAAADRLGEDAVRVGAAGQDFAAVVDNDVAGIAAVAAGSADRDQRRAGRRGDQELAASTRPPLPPPPPIDCAKMPCAPSPEVSTRPPLST